MKKHLLPTVFATLLTSVVYSQPTSAGGSYSESQARQARENAEMNRHYDSMKSSTPYSFQGTTAPPDLEGTFNTIEQLFGLKSRKNANRAPNNYVPKPYVQPVETESSEILGVRYLVGKIGENYYLGQDSLISFDRREGAYLQAKNDYDLLISRYGYISGLKEKFANDGAEINYALGVLYFNVGDYAKALPAFKNTGSLIDQKKSHTANHHLAYCYLMDEDLFSATYFYHGLYTDDVHFVSDLAYVNFLNNDYEGAIDVIDDFLASEKYSTDELIRVTINKSALLLFLNRNEEALKTYNQISKVEIKTRASLIENLVEHMNTFLTKDLSKGGFVYPGALFRMDLQKKLLPYDKNILAKSYAMNKVLSRSLATLKDEEAWKNLEGQTVPPNKTVDVYEKKDRIVEIRAYLYVGKNKAARLEAENKATVDKQNAEIAEAKRMEVAREEAVVSHPFLDNSLTGYVFTDWQSATQKMKWENINKKDAQIDRALKGTQVVYTQSINDAQTFFTNYKISPDKDWAFSVEFTTNSISNYAGQGIILKTKGYKGFGKEVTMIMYPRDRSTNLQLNYSCKPEYSYSNPWKEVVMYEYSRLESNPLIVFGSKPVTNVISVKKTGNKIELYVNYVFAEDQQIYAEPPYKSMDPTEFLNQITGIGIITKGQHSGSINKIMFIEADGNGDGESPIDKLWKR